MSIGEIGEVGEIGEIGEIIYINDYTYFMLFCILRTIVVLAYVSTLFIAY